MRRSIDDLYQKIDQIVVRPWPGQPDRLLRPCSIEAELPSILDRGPYNLQFLANDLVDFMYKMADIYKSLGSRLDSTKLR